jgi:hypothetical protein
MFADFLQFYGYKAEEALNEYAKRFFALCRSMYKLKARDNIVDLTNLSYAFAGGKDIKKLAEQYKKDYEGNDRILREIRNIKK